jgi:phosphoserine phosphatase RsbX
MGALTMGSRKSIELEWSVAQRALPGESLSGDGHLVAETAAGWLLAVVDGLGHGPEAALAAKTFIAILARHTNKPIVDLIRLGHKALRNTRGSVGALVTVDCGRRLLTWLGVGNVEGIILHDHNENPATEYITARGGIVGYRLPELQPSFLQLSDGDTLILATDGIQSGFCQAIPHQQPPDLLATHILDRYAKPTDDALVLVARWCFCPGKIMEE